MREFSLAVSIRQGIDDRSEFLGSSMKLIEHTYRIIEKLSIHRDAEGYVYAIPAVDLISSFGLVPSHYGKTFGQVVLLAPTEN